MENWAFFAVLAIALLEMVLASFWNRIYFLAGIPIFFYEIHLAQPGPVPPKAEELANRQGKSIWTPIQFRQFEDDRIAFREVVWSTGIRYTPIMRGILTFDAQGARVQVRGVANWFFLAFLILCITEIPQLQSASWLLIFLVALFGGMYVIQVKRFRDVAKAAAGAWETRPGIAP